MNYVQLLEEVKQEVTRFYHTHDTDALPYHNLDHTRAVVANAGRLARHYQLSDRDFFIVATAAWFHDAGYYISGMQGHEAAGVEMASAFLRSRQAGEEDIAQVSRCIMATRMPQAPEGLLEQIVCDADLYHLGTDQFPDQNKKMRKEMEGRAGHKIDKQQWRENTIQLLQSHHYHTDFAKTQLDNTKAQYLDKMKLKWQETQDEAASETVVPTAAVADTKVTVKPVEETKKGKPDRPDRGIETMFRISSNNHQRLSDMADNKAHIMITTTSIILSVLLSVLLRKLEDNPHLIIPTILLLTICVVTMVFCILATRPAIPGGTFTQDDIDRKKVNLLFFGNFYKMNFEDYDKGMRTMMNDREFLYGSLTRDVYSQGIVLGRKYRLLRAGYNVFMFGIIVSVLAFTLAVVVFGN